MKKVDIANELYEKIGISKKEAMDIVELVLDTLKDSLKNGEIVKIAGFGN
ncbi:MAG: HU family DNA-binding protein, partial [Nitrospirota bacterium]|nr:HU family DNA-binding protein [Nitrospirota bacterium]